jgi:hypothetical protein
LGAVEEATAEAEKHGDRSELLTALVAEAKGLIEQAKAEKEERVRVAAFEAAAAAAVKAAAAAKAVEVETAERLQMEDELVALSLRMQEVQQRLGSSRTPPSAPTTPAPHPDAEETMCVVCFDAPKEYAIVPCGHQCVCARCAEQLTKTRTPTCPVCREPIQQTMKVFCS